MDSQFITGFMINIETGNDTIYTTSLLKHLVLNITLEPNQWYLIIGRILTVDNDTWGPEPIYKYFQTPGKFNICYHKIIKSLPEKMAMKTLQNFQTNELLAEFSLISTQ